MAVLMAVGSALFRSSTLANKIGSTPLLPYLGTQYRCHHASVHQPLTWDTADLWLYGWCGAGWLATHVQQTPTSRPAFDLGSRRKALCTAIQAFSLA